MTQVSCVCVQWPGYAPLNYEIPVDGYGGYADLQSLARRVGRAVSHYLQVGRPIKVSSRF